MLKSEVQRMVKAAGGELEAQEIEVNGRILKVGQTKSTTMTVSCSEMVFEIIAFAPPAARGRIDKWDDNADVPSVIIRKFGNVHPSNEFEIKVASEF